MRYPRTLHLDDSGLGGTSSSRGIVKWRDLAGLNVVIEEKVDGSQISIEFSDDLEPVVAFRDAPLDMTARGGRDKAFDLLKDFVFGNLDSLFDILGTRFRLYGEWLYASHRIFYDGLPHFLLETDILDKDSLLFLDTPSRRALVSMNSLLRSVRVIESGTADERLHPRRFAASSGYKTPRLLENARSSCHRHGADWERFAARTEMSSQAEGIYGKVESEGRVILNFKWVRSDFVSGVMSSPHWRDEMVVPNVIRIAS